jgi:FixJ family two-component response regulator
MTSATCPYPRASVLVVEDDTSVRRSLQLLLRSQGLDVRAYASASQALADPLACSAHCLIADLTMPEVDGIALLAALRAQGWTGPAILVSGQIDEDIEQKGREAGFDAVLRKPIFDGQLTGRIAALIAAARERGDDL